MYTELINCVIDIAILKSLKFDKVWNSISFDESQIWRKHTCLMYTELVNCVTDIAILKLLKFDKVWNSIRFDESNLWNNL